uniref:Zinc finger LSD1-type domain-containing protein n=1 Tax=Setaria italica TaxID=4555 RepID=K4AFK9_SETIT
MVQKLVLVQTYSINTQEDKSNPESTAPLAPPGRGETSDAALARRPAASTSFSFFPEPHRRRRRAGSHPAPDAAMQNQIVCHACRTVLLYPRGAPSVCCALCQAVTTVPPPGLDMAQLICGGCRTLLMYTRSADTVRCSCCNTVNLVRPVNNIAHVNCGRCQTTLMYPYGAHSVKCAICNHVTATGVR